MKANLVPYNTLIENDKKYNDFQRTFFKAISWFSKDGLQYRKLPDRTIYWMKLDRADIIHIGLLLIGP